MIVGCYTLDLYCDTPECENGRAVHTSNSDGIASAPATFTAEHGSECRKDARRAGWRLELREGLAWCPLCTGRKKGTGS